MDDLLPAALQTAMTQLRQALLAGQRNESAMVLSLQGEVVVGRTQVGRGDADRVSLSPAEVLRPALQQGGDAFVLLHTHLSDAPPSPADQAVTRRLVAASAVVGLRLLAHLVVTPTGCHVVTGDRRA